MSVNKKLRVLCLHGYHQNKDIFQTKIGSFRKRLKKYADFEFLEAPHLLKDSVQQENSIDPAYLVQVSENSCSDGRGWWFKFPPENGNDGLQESLDLFESFIETKGPFDGVMGFSQGAAFLSLACLPLKEKLLAASVKFLIIVAGFKSSMPAHQHFYQSEAKISIPALLVIGDTDGIILPDRSRELLDFFVNIEVATHPGGHYVPATKDFSDVYINFIKQFTQQ